MRYIFLIRAHHWVKNLFIFIPVFFSGDLFESALIFRLIQGFFCFCLVSSSVYILNDILDIESDRKHPTKMNRPIASGKVSIHLAITVMTLMALAGLGWSYWLQTEFFLLCAAYLIINVAYSLGLKNISLVDVFLVSSGFLIRTISGGVLTDIYISRWLIIMIFLLALLLTFSKRRDDLIKAKSRRISTRKSCREYNLEFINIVLSLIAGVIIVSYLMYTFSGELNEKLEKNYLYATGLFVFGGILRYLQITLVNGASGSPTKIFLTDKIIQFTVLAWTLAFFITIYIV